jgi:hypothetical protein
MTRRTFFTGLVLLVAVAFAKAADKPDGKPATPAAATTNATNVQVIAYYFHGTVRCETCLKIERQAREVIEQRFKQELTSKRLVFKPVNYDLPENAHFMHDYKLPCPSLVLVRQADGKDQQWQLLDKTWKLVGDEGKFNKYIEDETAGFVKALR